MRALLHLTTGWPETSGSSQQKVFARASCKAGCRFVTFDGRTGPTPEDCQQRNNKALAYFFINQSRPPITTNTYAN